MRIDVTRLLLAAALSVEIILPCVANESRLDEIERMMGLREYARAAIELEPLVNGEDFKDSRAHYLYAKCLIRTGRQGEAKISLENCIKYSPNSWFALDAKNLLEEIKPPSPIMGSQSKGGRNGFTGMTVAADGTVHSVIEATSAARAHVLPGDKILTIDGTPAPKDLNQLLQRLHGLLDSSVSLVIERNGKKYSCILKRDSSIQQIRSQNYASGKQLVPAGQPKQSQAALQTPPSIEKTEPKSTIANSIDQSMVSIFRRTSDSEVIRDKVLQTLRLVPSDIKESLSDWGLKILITPTILDAIPDLVNEKPRGYTHGGGYSNCPGLYRAQTKTVYVAERFSLNSHPTQSNEWMPETLLHETGHAYDSYSGISKSAGFRKAYEDDCFRITNTLRDKYYYFLQEQDAGPQEMFAELFALVNSPGKQRASRLIELGATFPKCSKFVQELCKKTE